MYCFLGPGLLRSGRLHPYGIGFVVPFVRLLDASFSGERQNPTCAQVTTERSRGKYATEHARVRTPAHSLLYEAARTHSCKYRFSCTIRYICVLTVLPVFGGRSTGTAVLLYRTGFSMSPFCWDDLIQMSRSAEWTGQNSRSGPRRVRIWSKEKPRIREFIDAVVLLPRSSTVLNLCTSALLDPGSCALIPYECIRGGNHRGREPGHRISLRKFGPAGLS